MVEHKATAQSRGVKNVTRQDPLEYWYDQEIAPLKNGDPTDLPHNAHEERRMVNGWWIVPVLLLSVAAWVAIGVAVF